MNFSDTFIACYRDAELVAVVIFRSEEKFTDFIFSFKPPSVWLAQELGLEEDYFSDCYFDEFNGDLKGICQASVFEIY
ncbi:MAG: hypothetical protein JHC31_15445 [Sulfurihydrogenibium sp.]|jgi:hypothetical protein|nr:hypothetical protein [Sulfurihydrogenibium sp.]MBX0313133.1 hypothetical protein [Sulfurihydrogenibium sp.]